MIWPTIFFVLLLLSCSIAWWRGAAPERIVALGYLIAWFITVIVQDRGSDQYLSAQLAIVLVDVALFVLLLAVALRANRYWPMVATSAQFVLLIAHLMRSIDPEMMRVVYVVMLWIWPFLQLGILTAGSILHWQRVARNGAEPSWSRSSGLSSRSAPNPWPTD